SIFEQADASPARIEIARLSVVGQTEILVVAAPDHGVKIKGGAGFLHGFDQHFGLEVRHHLVDGPMHDQRGRLARVHVMDRAGRARDLGPFRGRPAQKSFTLVVIAGMGRVKSAIPKRSTTQVTSLETFRFSPTSNALSPLVAPSIATRWPPA